MIRSLMAEHPGHHRLALSRLVCERLDWRRPNGGLKDMSCRVAMLRMHRDGLIQLPPPQQACYNGRLRRRRTPQAEPQLPITGSLQGLSELHLRPLAKGAEAALWREYVDRYHYLGYTPLAGAQLRYLVRSGPQVLAVLGFAACAWKVAPRDRFIGWSAAQREARLQLVVNNARFLILPWVQVKNLVLGARAQLPPVAGRLAQPLRLPPPAAGDLRPIRSVRRHQLPCRQLDPRRANPRPRQTRCPQPTRSAQEGHLALSAPPGFPPPPLRPARPSLQPVDRIFTAGGV